MDRKILERFEGTLDAPRGAGLSENLEELFILPAPHPNEADTAEDLSEWLYWMAAGASCLSSRVAQAALHDEEMDPRQALLLLDQLAHDLAVLAEAAALHMAGTSVQIHENPIDNQGREVLEHMVCLLALGRDGECGYCDFAAKGIGARLQREIKKLAEAA